MDIQEFKNKVTALLPSNSFGSIKESDFRTLFNDLADIISNSSGLITEASDEEVREGVVHGKFISPATSRLSRINNIAEVSGDYIVSSTDNTLLVTAAMSSITFGKISSEIIGTLYTVFLFQPRGFTLIGDSLDSFISASGSAFTIPTLPCKITLEIISSTQFLCTLESVSDDKYYEVEFTDQTTVTVVHNLGKQPSVTLLDINGEEHDVAVDHIDINTCIVSWNGQLSGKITCN